jgi:hypothetical protein
MSKKKNRNKATKNLPIAEPFLPQFSGLPVDIILCVFLLWYKETEKIIIPFKL